MKKFFALMLAVLLCVGIVFLTGCGSETETENDTTVESPGQKSYFIKTFHTEEEYLDFLEVFDFGKYEIVDISISQAYRRNNDYSVTYRAKATSEENTNTSESTITVKEILQNDSDYVVIASDDTITVVSKSVSKIVVSAETNVVILEKNGDTITKATFCITQEMLESLN